MATPDIPRALAMLVPFACVLAASAAPPPVESLSHAVQPDEGTAPGASRNGRVVAFAASWRDGGGGRYDPAGEPAVFLWDRRLGTVAPIAGAVAADQPSASNATFRLPLGANLVDETRARTVIAFRSEGNPAGGNGDGSAEIFVWDSVTGGVTQITSALSGASSAPAVGARFVPQENAAGRPTGTILLRYRVAFLSTADLEGDSPAGPAQVFLHDSGADAVGRLRQVSYSLTHAAGRPAVDADGRRVVFVHGDDLLPGSGPAGAAVYLHDTVRGLSRLSGAESVDPEDPVLDARGRFAAWSATPAAGGPRAVFLADVRRGDVRRVDTSGAAASSPSLGRGRRDVALLLGDGEGGGRPVLVRPGRGPRPLSGADGGGGFGPPSLLRAAPMRVLVTSTGNLDGTNPAGRSKMFLLRPER